VLCALKGTEVGDELNVDLTLHRAIPLVKTRKYFIAFDSPKDPTPPDRGEILSDLTNFFSTNGALRAVKETEAGDDLHVDLTWYCGKS